MTAINTSHPGWQARDLTPLPDQPRGRAALAALAVVRDGLTHGLDPSGPQVGAALEMIGLLPYEPGIPPSGPGRPGQGPPIRYPRPGQR